MNMEKSTIFRCVKYGTIWGNTKSMKPQLAKENKKAMILILPLND